MAGTDDLVNALSGGSLLNQIAHPSSFNPLASANSAATAATNIWSVRDAQAKQAAGEAFQGAIDPSTGVFNPEKFRQNLQAAGPGAALAAQSGLGANQALSTAQVNQASTVKGLIANTVAPLINLPDDQIHQGVANAAHQLIGMGVPAQGVIGGLVGLSNDPATMRQQLERIRQANLTPEQQQQNIYGTPTQLQTGGAIQGATQSPQTGAIAPAGAAVPMTLTPGEGEQRIPTIDNNQYLPDGRTPNPNYGQPITVPLRTQVPGAQGRPAVPPQAGQPPAAPVAAPGATAPPGGAPGAAQRESYVLGPDGKPQKVLVPTQPAPAPGGALPTALPPGADITIKAANDAWATANTNANSYAQRSFPVAQALALAKSGTLTTGAGASAINDIKSWLQTRAATFGVDAQTIANSNFQQLEKYLQQNVNAQPMASGSDARLASALTGNPSAHLNTLALVDVLKATQALQRMEQMAVLDFRARGEPNGQWNRFMSDWQTHHDPRAFVFDQMDADQQRKMVMGMTGPERASFQRSLDLIKQHPEILNTAAMPH